jgi:hypothetical protein
MTNIRVVRYTTRPEAVEENSRLVSAVYEELSGTGSDTFRYATLLLPEEGAWVHVAVSDDDHPPLPDLPAFERFLSGLDHRILTPVVAAPAVVVGSYRML